MKNTSSPENVKNEALSDNVLRNLAYENIYFLSIAEPHAMGNGGNITVISLEKQNIFIRQGNYVHGDLNMDKLSEIFPPLQNFSFDNPHNMEDWHYEYMGSGNHLLVRNDVYKEFETLCKDSSYENQSRKKFHIPWIKKYALPRPMSIYVSYTNYAVRILKNMSTS